MKKLFSHRRSSNSLNNNVSDTETLQNAVGRSSLQYERSSSQIPVKLPLLQDVPPRDRKFLMSQKLQSCCFAIKLSGSERPNVKMLNQRMEYLMEMTDFIQVSKDVHCDSIYSLIVDVFKCNVFRDLPMPNPFFDPEEDDPVYDPAWIHLKYVYEFFLRFLESRYFRPSAVKNMIDRKFIAELVDMFASEDTNEREKLHIILHHLYAKFLGLRPCIRDAISMRLLDMISEKLRFPGAPEILDLTGSIIMGFKTPLKKQHKQFLRKILLPLHFTDTVKEYFSHLVFCVVQLLEKDPNLIEQFMMQYLKRWPKYNSEKLVLLLSELEEFIDAISPESFQKIEDQVFRKIAECVKSENFQVAKRALLYWDNDYIISLMEVNAKKCSGILLPNLLYTSKHHWNKTVVEMSVKAISHFLKESSLPELVDQVKTIKMEAATKRQSLDAGWTAVEDQARRNSECIPVPILEEET